MHGRHLACRCYHKGKKHCSDTDKKRYYSEDSIDIFIAELGYRNKGLGTEIIKLLNKTLFEKYNANVIVIDPKVNNSRAIACFKKCGFKECFIAKQREEKDGIKYDNLIMKIEK